MLETLSRSWALLLGMLLLMVGNGTQGTVLGIRGTMEGFSTTELSLVMSAYFAGFLGGSRLAPELIRRVGHVRVFAALASMISAVLILFPTIVNPVAWILLRVLFGFCISGVYVTAESWLNNASSNENRGTALSLYLIVQMIGLIVAQVLVSQADPSGFMLFVVPSVLVSVAFAPILLSVTPTPAFETAKPMGFGELFRATPLSCVGIFLLGAIFSALFGMASVYGSEAGMSVAEISGFVSAIYLGGLVLQFPTGFISDRMDRRQLIVYMAGLGLTGCLVGIMWSSYTFVLVAGFVAGGVSMPLYGLLIAHANDHLDPEDMSAASGRLLFLNGVGAVGGPMVTGALMSKFGPLGFFVFLLAALLLLLCYGLYRSTQRPSPAIDTTGSYAPILPTATPVAAEVAQDFYIDATGTDEKPDDSADLEPT